MSISQLTIRHNHGVWILQDVELIPREEECRKAKGTVVKGHSTSRLFGHCATEHEVPGSVMEVDLWNRRIYQQYGAPEGHMEVSIQFC